MKQYAEPLIASIAKDFGRSLSYEEIRKAFELWTLVPIIHAGEHLATLMFNGTEVHVAARMRPKSSCRQAVRKALETQFNTLGFLTTRVPVAQAKNKRFVERVGFKPTWCDGVFQYYLLAQLPWSRKETKKEP